MLSIAVRGWDERATTTTEALQLAERLDRRFEQATARGVLAGIDLMRADYRAALQHATASVEQGADAGSRALGRAFLAAGEADRGQNEQAVRHGAEAVAAAEESADPIHIVYATAYAGHALLFDDDIDRARIQFERAVAAAAPILVLLPWPLAMLAETEVRAGNLQTASALATRAGAISATTNIAYQRALALRVDALIDSARGDHEAAVDRLLVALSQARRTTGEGYTFHWPVAWILESLASVTANTDPEASRRWAETLLDHASAVEMRTFIDRATRLLTRAPAHD
jgi:tetratricopeptide (TPR) repeat protein